MSDPANFVFDAMRKIARQSPLPTWEDLASADSQGRRDIARRWHSEREINTHAMLFTMRYEQINGPIDEPNPHREFDYDGDLGREHDAYLRDNGAGRHGIRPWRQIGDVLPHVDAPSIVAELPATQPVKTESEG